MQWALIPIAPGIYYFIGLGDPMSVFRQFVIRTSFSFPCDLQHLRKLCLYQHPISFIFRLKIFYLLCLNHFSGLLF